MDETEELLLIPDLLLWQAEVLELAGRTADADASLRKAAEAAARKGALVTSGGRSNCWPKRRHFDDPTRNRNA